MSEGGDINLLRNNNPQLPEDAEVFRASGDYVCEVCGHIFYDHQKFNYPTSGFVVRGCDSVFYHL